MWIRSAVLIGVLLWPFEGYAQSWKDMSPRQRYDAMQNYRRFEQQPTNQQHKLQENYQRWQGLSPQEQERLRHNYERWQQMPPAEQRRLEEKYERWKKEGEDPDGRD